MNILVRVHGRRTENDEYTEQMLSYQFGKVILIFDLARFSSNPLNAMRTVLPGQSSDQASLRRRRAQHAFA